MSARRSIRRRAVTSETGMDTCRHCGEPMGWPEPVGVIFADRSAAHHACDERAEKERLARLRKAVDEGRLPADAIGKLPRPPWEPAPGAGAAS